MANRDGHEETQSAMSRPARTVFLMNQRQRKGLQARGKRND